MFIHFLIDKQHENNDYLNKLIKSESHKVTDSWVDEEIENKIAKCLCLREELFGNLGVMYHLNLPHKLSVHYRKCEGETITLREILLDTETCDVEAFRLCGCVCPSRLDTTNIR